MVLHCKQIMETNKKRPPIWIHQHNGGSSSIPCQSNSYARWYGKSKKGSTCSQISSLSWLTERMLSLMPGEGSWQGRNVQSEGWEGRDCCFSDSPHSCCIEVSIKSLPERKVVYGIVVGWSLGLELAFLCLYRDTDCTHGLFKNFSFFFNCPSPGPLTHFLPQMSPFLQFSWN